MSTLDRLREDAKQTWINTPHGDDVWGKVVESVLCGAMDLSLQDLGEIRAGFVAGTSPAPHEAEISLIVKGAVQHILDEGQDRAA